MLSVVQILVRAIKPDRGTARRMALALTVLSTLVACGQTGVLYLPTEPAAAQRATLPETLNPYHQPAKVPTPAAGASSPGSTP